jgi:glutathione gamma-glutamylcysteinyltransferase
MIKQVRRDGLMVQCLIVVKPWLRSKKKGIRYGKAACLAHCNGAKAESFRTNEITDVVSDWKWAFLTLTITKTRMFWFLIYQGSVNGIRSLVTQENMIDTLSVCW